MGGLRSRRRGVRPALLPHLAARGRDHGPPGAALPRGLLGGAGGRGVRPGDPRNPARGRLGRGDVRALPALRRRSGAPGEERGPRRLLRVDREPGLVHVRLPGTEPRPRLDVLVLPHGAAPRVRFAPPRRGRRGPGGRRERHDPPAEVPPPEPGEGGLDGRAVPQLRRRRGRVRAGRGSRGPRPEAAFEGARRRGPHPRARPRDRGRPRGADERLHGARPGRPGGGDRGGARARGRAGEDGELPGGARDGDRPGRPDRGGGAHPRLPGDDGRRRVLCDRLPQVERRPPRGGRGRGRGDEGPPPDAARPARSFAPRRGAEPPHRLLPHAVRPPARGGPLAPAGIPGGRRRPPAAPGRGELVRRRGLERSRRPRGVRLRGRDDPPRGSPAALRPLGQERGAAPALRAAPRGLPGAASGRPEGRRPSPRVRRGLHAPGGARGDGVEARRGGGVARDPGGEAPPVRRRGSRIERRPIRRGRRADPAKCQLSPRAGGGGPPRDGGLSPARGEAFDPGADVGVGGGPRLATAPLREPREARPPSDVPLREGALLDARFPAPWTAGSRRPRGPGRQRDGVVRGGRRRPPARRSGRGPRRGDAVPVRALRGGRRHRASRRGLFGPPPRRRLARAGQGGGSPGRRPSRAGAGRSGLAGAPRFPGGNPEHRGAPRTRPGGGLLFRAGRPRHVAPRRRGRGARPLRREGRKGASSGRSRRRLEALRAGIERGRDLRGAPRRRTRPRRPLPGDRGERDRRGGGDRAAEAPAGAPPRARDAPVSPLAPRRCPPGGGRSRRVLARRSAPRSLRARRDPRLRPASGEPRGPRAASRSAGGSHPEVRRGPGRPVGPDGRDDAGPGGEGPGPSGNGRADAPPLRAGLDRPVSPLSGGSARGSADPRRGGLPRRAGPGGFRDGQPGRRRGSRKGLRFHGGGALRGPARRGRRLPGPPGAALPRRTGPGDDRSRLGRPRRGRCGGVLARARAGDRDPLRPDARPPRAEVDPRRRGALLPPLGRLRSLSRARRGSGVRPEPRAGEPAGEVPRGRLRGGPRGDRRQGAGDRVETCRHRGRPRVGRAAGASPPEDRGGRARRGRRGASPSARGLPRDGRPQGDRIPRGAPSRPDRERPARPRREVRGRRRGPRAAGAAGGGRGSGRLLAGRRGGLRPRRAPRGRRAGPLRRPQRGRARGRRPAGRVPPEEDGSRLRGGGGSEGRGGARPRRGDGLPAARPLRPLLLAGRDPGERRAGRLRLRQCVPRRLRGAAGALAGGRAAAGALPLDRLGVLEGRRDADERGRRAPPRGERPPVARRGERPRRFPPVPLGPGEPPRGRRRGGAGGRCPGGGRGRRRGRGRGRGRGVLLGGDAGTSGGAPGSPARSAAGSARGRGRAGRWPGRRRPLSRPESPGRAHPSGRPVPRLRGRLRHGPRGDARPGGDLRASAEDAPLRARERRPALGPPGERRLPSGPAPGSREGRRGTAAAAFRPYRRRLDASRDPCPRGGRRDHRARGAVPDGAGPRHPLDEPGGRARLRHRGAGRPLGRGVVRRGRGPGQVDLPVGRLPRRRGPVRPPVLRDHPAGSRADGPAGAPLPGGGLADGRGRRPDPRSPREEPGGRLRRRDVGPVPAVRGRVPRPGRGRPRLFVRFHREPGLLLLRLHGAEPRPRHDVLLLAHRDPPRVREPPPGRV